MAAHEILTSPHPTLRDRATKVKAFTSKLDQLIEDMIETMRASSGVGLAAPQIGVNQRVIVVEYAEGSEDPEAPPKPPTRIFQHEIDHIQGALYIDRANQVWRIEADEEEESPTMV